MASHNTGSPAAIEPTSASRYFSMITLSTYWIAVAPVQVCSPMTTLVLASASKDGAAVSNAASAKLTIVPALIDHFLPVGFSLSSSSSPGILGPADGAVEHHGHHSDG